MYDPAHGGGELKILHHPCNLTRPPTMETQIAMFHSVRSWIVGFLSVKVCLGRTGFISHIFLKQKCYTITNLFLRNVNFAEIISAPIVCACNVPLSQLILILKNQTIFFLWLFLPKRCLCNFFHFGLGEFRALNELPGDLYSFFLGSSSSDPIGKPDFCRRQQRL